MHVIMAAITRPDSAEDLDAGVETGLRHASRPMLSTRFRVHDPENDGQVKSLFVFPDVNVMIPGTYRLRFTHLQIRG